VAVNTLLLSRLNLLQGLDDGLLADLALKMSLWRFAKGGLVVRKGDDADTLAFVYSGRLQVVDITADGREIGLGFVNEGDHFGEMALIDGGTRSASVVAVVPSEVITLPRVDATHLMFHNPVVSQRVMNRLVQMVRNTSQQLAMVNNQAVHQRVATVLMRMAQPSPDDANAGVIEPLPSQKQLAMVVNASRETVSRCINELVRQGLVTKEKNVLVIRSVAKLRSIAS